MDKVICVKTYRRGKLITSKTFKDVPLEYCTEKTEFLENGMRIVIYTAPQSLKELLKTVQM